jgi:methyl-accepting chemotaxis protein
VRQLASKTHKSIEQIQSIIQQLQLGARSAVQLMDLAKGRAHDGVDKVEESAESLGMIAGEVVTILDMNERIAEAASGQRATVESLHRQIGQIRQGVVGASEQWQAISDLLEQLVAFQQRSSTEK